MIPTTIRLTDKQRKWIKEMNLNVTQYVRTFMDKDMANRQFKARFVQMIHYLLIKHEFENGMISPFYEQIMAKNGINP